MVSANFGMRSPNMIYTFYSNLGASVCSFDCTITNFPLTFRHVVTVETFIICKTLQFYGQSCRLSCGYLTRSLFARILGVYTNGDRHYIVFISDIYKTVWIHVGQPNSLFPEGCVESYSPTDSVAIKFTESFEYKREYIAQGSCLVVRLVLSTHAECRSYGVSIGIYPLFHLHNTAIHDGRHDGSYKVRG